MNHTDTARLEKLKRRFSYEQWAGVNKLRRNLFIWKYKMASSDLPEWVPHRIQRLGLPGQPKVLTSIWKRPDGGTDTLIGLDVYECDTRALAQDMALNLLDNFQSPLVNYVPDSPTGDVAFGDENKTWLMFTRANLVAIIRNAGKTLTQVNEQARLLDTALASEPPATAPAPAPAVGEVARAMRGASPFGGAAPPVVTARFSFRRPRAAAVPGAGADDYRIEVETPEVLETAAYVKAFSKTGEVFAQDDNLVYHPERPDTQEVLLYTVVPDAYATSQVLRVGPPQSHGVQPLEPPSSGGAGAIT